MWKYIHDSVIGTSHLGTDGECQDTSLVTPYSLGDSRTALVLVCADGAGSATHSKIGSLLACNTAIACVAEFFGAGKTPESVTPAVLRGWLDCIHHAIVAEAAKLELPVREMACTLLLSIVCDSTAAFMQVGDGVIVIHDGTEYRFVFWPQNGEYQNTTYFVTDPQYQENVLVELHSGNIENLAMLTDGLQMLVLNYATRAVHKPFFDPLFRALREQPSDELAVPLKQFLGSDAVNQRTDDDKTLILASKVLIDVQPSI